MSESHTRSKSVFIISPIGSQDSLTRVRSDQLRHHIIEPVAFELGFTVIRADDMSLPGRIDTQIANFLVNSDVVIADLTDHNPNVFYELGVRHASKKPAILMIQSGQTIPFDIGRQRVIQYDLSNLDIVVSNRLQIKSQLNSILNNEYVEENPIADLDVYYQTLQLSQNLSVESDYLLNSVIHSLQEKGVNVENNNLIINSKGVIINPDILIKNNDVNYIIELKNIKKQVGWEHISQIKDFMDILDDTEENTSKGFLVVFGAQPSDAIRNYARDYNIDIIWMPVESEGVDDQSIAILADDIVRRIRNV